MGNRRTAIIIALACLAICIAGCATNSTPAGQQGPGTPYASLSSKKAAPPIGAHWGAGNYGIGTTGNGKPATSAGTMLGGGLPSNATNAGGSGDGNPGGNQPNGPAGREGSGGGGGNAPG